jgi:hypothetical protein
MAYLIPGYILWRVPELGNRQAYQHNLLLISPKKLASYYVASYIINTNSLSQIASFTRIVCTV